LLSKNRTLLLFFCVLWGGASQAQIYLNEVHGPILNYGLLVEDSTFVLNGIVTRPDTVCNSFVHRDRMYTRFDFNGNMVDSLFIINDFCAGNGHRGDIKRLNDSVYFQSGWVGDWPNDPGVNAELQLIKSDLSDTIKTIKFQYTPDLTTNWFFSELDGNDRIFGLGLLPNDTNTNFGFFVPWIFRINADLSVTNLAILPSNNQTRGLYPTSLALGPQGQIIIGAQDYVSFDEDDYNGWVIVLDSTGSELWRHRMWNVPNRYDCGPEVFATSDGNYIVANQRGYDQNTEPLYFNENRISIKKLSPAGNVLWEKEYGNSSILFPDPSNPAFEPNFRPFKIKQNGVGDLFIAGHNYAWSAILKISSNGDSLWYREIRDRIGNYSNVIQNSVKEVNYLYDMELLGDSAILVAGQYQTDPGGAVYPNGAQLNWFALLDQNGCDSVGCQYIRIIEPQNPLQELTIYPNPVKDILRVTGAQTEEYEVLDLMGRTVLQGFLNEGINVSKLPSGTYVLRIGNEGRRFVKD